MKSHRSVHEAINELTVLHGQPIEIEGVLGAESEGYELLHYPKVERRVNSKDEGPIYSSSVWLAFGSGSLQPNHSALSRWVGKRVRVYGVLHAPSSQHSFGAFGKGGFGPYGFWPAEVECYSVQRVTSEERRENGA